jgi:hypothetical protein
MVNLFCKNILPWLSGNEKFYHIVEVFSLVLLKLTLGVDITKLVCFQCMPVGKKIAIQFRQH